MPSEFQRLRRDFGWAIEDHAEQESGVWVLPQQRKESYPDSGHASLAEAEDGSFWFRHRNRVVIEALKRLGPPAALWDVGGGNGYVSLGLHRAGVEAVTVEPGPVGSKNAAARGLRSVVQGRFDDLSLPDASLPAIGAFDVIEHIEDPEPLLAEFARCLRPEGLLLVTVPALNALWSGYDEVAGHFRRYTVRDLDREIERAGLRRVARSYFMLPLVPPVYVLRARPHRTGSEPDMEELLRRTVEQQRSERRGLATRAMELALTAERWWMRRGHLPTGTSIIGAYQRPS
ncbi:MAG: class I SAM-dependent methyltransferase [Myxococcota bacterium]